MLLKNRKREIVINQLKRIALDGLKSREKLIGRKVRFIGREIDIDGRLNKNGIYTISKISSGNYQSFIYLEELEKERYSPYSRKVVPNCFNVERFELVDQSE
jgi:hypothetical protein